MGFLGNAKKSAPIILAEFHVEVFPLDLDLFRFDNIVHAAAECGRARTVGKAKNLPKLTSAKAACPSPPQLLATARLRPIPVRSQIGDSEIDLTLKLIYPRNMHAQFITDSEAPPP